VIYYVCVLLAQLSRHRGGGMPPLPAAVGARALSGARLVWCVSSCRAPFAFCFFSLLLRCISSSAVCARAGRNAPCARRCSGTVPAAPRAAPPSQLFLLHRALGSSQCPTLAVRTTATAFHNVRVRSHVSDARRLSLSLSFSPRSGSLFLPLRSCTYNMCVCV